MIDNKKSATIEYDGIKLFGVSLVPEIKTGNKNVNMDFETLIAAIPQIPNSTRACYYQGISKACAFCALKKDKIMLSPKTLLSAYKQVFRKTGRRPKILLTGGNDFSPDRGLAKYIPYVKKVREFDGKAKIAIEASPPKELENMEKLANLKIDTFSANLEVYSDRFRNKFLPGKSEIKINEYKDTFNYNKKNGVKVFSVLIAGLEDEQGTLDGIRYLSEIGVPTNLLCLRSFPGASLENHEKINPMWFLRITKKAILMMDKKGLTDKLSKTSGCGSCGACSMEINLHRLAKKYGKNVLNIF
jgi:biotin synthase-like enzyme